MKIILLEISTFMSVSLDALHYYGKLYQSDPYECIELKHRLTQSEVTELNKRRAEMGYLHDSPYKAGRIIDGFIGQDAVRHTAKDEWLKHFPDAHYLVEGHFASVEPKTVLACSFADVTCEEIIKINYIVEQSKEIDKKYRKPSGWISDEALDLIDKLEAEWKNHLLNLLITKPRR